MRGTVTGMSVSRLGLVSEVEAYLVVKGGLAELVGIVARVGVRQAACVGWPAHHSPIRGEPVEEQNCHCWRDVVHALQYLICTMHPPSHIQILSHFKLSIAKAWYGDLAPCRKQPTSEYVNGDT